MKRTVACSPSRSTKRPKSAARNLPWIPDDVLWKIGQHTLQLGGSHYDRNSKICCLYSPFCNGSDENTNFPVGLCLNVVHDVKEDVFCPNGRTCKHVAFAKFDTTYREKERVASCMLSKDAIYRVNGLRNFLNYSSVSRRLRILLLERLVEVDLSFRCLCEKPPGHSLVQNNFDVGNSLISNLLQVRTLRLTVSARMKTRTKNVDYEKRSYEKLMEHLRNLKKLEILSLQFHGYRSQRGGDYPALLFSPESELPLVRPFFDNLMKFHLSGSFNLLVLQQLKHLKNLEHLVLEHTLTNCRDHGSCKDLESTSLKEDLHEAVSNLSGLTCLNLRGCLGILSVTSWDLKKLSKLKNLEISGQRPCRGASLFHETEVNVWPQHERLGDAFLGTITSLERLDLTENKTISGKHFSNLTNLQRLDVRSSSFKVKNLASFSSLEMLTLHNLQGHVQSQVLKGHANLKRLKFSGSGYIEYRATPNAHNFQAVPKMLSESMSALRNLCELVFHVKEKSLITIQLCIEQNVEDLISCLTSLKKFTLVVLGESTEHDKEIEPPPGDQKYIVYTRLGNLREKFRFVDFCCRWMN